MIFIALLVLTTSFIAGAAAFFSVYGLASTFSGTFWSVVLMGASLEAGKLIAASYLYRYWAKTNKWLKTYLMAGVATLMILTSTGIFGYLSSGYQQDVLPLKQAEEQVKVLEGEKDRLIARKTQIDEQIAQLPTNSVRGRVQLIKGFKEEQASVTKRISELDREILGHKTKLIQTQAHIGPITYIASAFGLDTDNATKYLIYLIIFAFDPMAVALTLAVNIAIRLRKEEIEEAERQEHEERMRKMQLEHEERMMAEKFAKEEAETVAAPVMVTEDFIDDFKKENRSTKVDTLPELSPWQAPDPVIEEQPEWTDEKVTEFEAVMAEYADETPAPTVEHDHTPEPLPEPEVVSDTPIDDAGAVMIAEEVQPIERPGDHLLEDEPVDAEPTSALPADGDGTGQQVRRRFRPYGKIQSNMNDAKLAELMQHYRWLKDKEANGEGLTQDDRWELSAIEEILRKHGLGLYLS